MVALVLAGASVALSGCTEEPDARDGHPRVGNAVSVCDGRISTSALRAILGTDPAPLGYISSVGPTGVGGCSIIDAKRSVLTVDFEIDRDGRQYAARLESVPPASMIKGTFGVGYPLRGDPNVPGDTAQALASASPNGYYQATTRNPVEPSQIRALIELVESLATDYARLSSTTTTS